MPRRWSSACRSSAASSSRPRAICKPLKPEDVGYTARGLLARRAEVGHLGGQDLRHPDQQRDDGVHLERRASSSDAGLDPEKPPATWDDVVAYSKQIHDKLGIAGYGLVAKQNAGNTPFRFMPQLWAYGGGALDEAEPSPTYEDDLAQQRRRARRALQASYDMYVRDKSVPTSALTNTQTENQAPFIAGQLGMMIAHPSEYAMMLDLRRARRRAPTRTVADEVVANMRYGLIPKGPARRAVVFGGSNIHVVKPEYVDGGYRRARRPRRSSASWTSPEWSTKMAWVGSNPGNLARLQDRVDEGTPGHHQVPRRHDLDAAERHPVPGACPRRPRS